MKKILEKFWEMRRVLPMLVVFSASAVFLDVALRPGPDSLSTSPRAGKELVETASRVRDELNRALALLEECFGYPVDLDRVHTLPVTLTAYTSSVLECDDDPHITASMRPVRRGTIAVSRDLMKEMGLAFGQKVLIPGYGIYEVHDRMNRRWKRSVDIWHDDREAALLFGRQQGTLIWVASAESPNMDLVAKNFN